MRELTDVVVFVGLEIVDPNDLRLRDNNLFIEFVALLLIHLRDKIASHQISDYAFFWNLQATLSSESVDGLYFKSTSGVDDAAGKFFS